MRGYRQGAGRPVEMEIFLQVACWHERAGSRLLGELVTIRENVLDDKSLWMSIA